MHNEREARLARVARPNLQMATAHAINRIAQQLALAEAEYPQLAAPDGTVAVDMNDLRALLDTNDRMRDTLALGQQFWRVCHYGSEPGKGDTIHAVNEHGSRGADIAFLGDGPHAHEAAGKIVAAHNSGINSLAALEPVQPSREAVAAICANVPYDRWSDYAANGTTYPNAYQSNVDQAYAKADAILALFPAIPVDVPAFEDGALREALEAVQGAMLYGLDGSDFGWNITALNKARPIIRAALSTPPAQVDSSDGAGS